MTLPQSSQVLGCCSLKSGNYDLLLTIGKQSCAMLLEYAVHVFTENEHIISRVTDWFDLKIGKIS
jgi:hypothetical protein